MLAPPLFSLRWHAKWAFLPPWTCQLASSGWLLVAVASGVWGERVINNTPKCRRDTILKGKLNTCRRNNNTGSEGISQHLIDHYMTMKQSPLSSRSQAFTWNWKLTHTIPIINLHYTCILDVYFAIERFVLQFSSCLDKQLKCN